MSKKLEHKLQERRNTEVQFSRPQGNAHLYNNGIPLIYCSDYN